MKKMLFTKYVIPLSVPASYGYKLSSLCSIHEQLLRHNSKPETPTIQSGEGSIKSGFYILYFKEKFHYFIMIYLNIGIYKIF